MGIWGYKLFDDDCALDVRGNFRDLIGKGLTPEQATRQMVKDWRPVKWDSQEYASFWLALAAAQWDLGRLTERAKTKALEVLDKGIGLDAWADAPLKAKEGRRRIYRELRRKLLRKPPPPKHVARRYQWVSPWKKGWLISYRCLSGRVIFFRVLYIHNSAGGESAIVDICKWSSQTPPTPAQASRLGAVRYTGLRGTTFPERMALYATRASSFPADRLAVVGRGVKRPRGSMHSSIFGGFAALDAYLEDALGIK